MPGAPHPRPAFWGAKLEHPVDKLLFLSSKVRSLGADGSSPLACYYSRLRGTLLAEASDPAGSRNGSTAMRSYRTSSTVRSPVRPGS